MIFAEAGIHADAEHPFQSSHLMVDGCVLDVLALKPIYICCNEIACDISRLA